MDRWTDRQSDGRAKLFIVESAKYHMETTSLSAIETCKPVIKGLQGYNFNDQHSEHIVITVGDH